VPGEQEIEITKKGYADWERKVLVEAGKKLDINVELEAKDRRQSKISKFFSAPTASSGVWRHTPPAQIKRLGPVEGRCPQEFPSSLVLRQFSGSPKDHQGEMTHGVWGEGK
jgi:hypothetical protein